VGAARLWPTANTRGASSAARHTTTTDAMHPGTTLTDMMRLWYTPDTPSGGRGLEATLAKTTKAQIGLENQARLWATAVKSDAGRGSDAYPHGEGNPTLKGQARVWATPTSRDVKGGNPNQRVGSPDLAMQTERFHHCPTTETDGSPTSPPVVLNPRFVGALMGFPEGWHSLPCEATETPSSPTAPHTPFAALRESC